MVMQFELYRTLNPAMKRPKGSLRHETSPPKFSASGRQRCRLHRASLGRKPIRPAGAHHRFRCRRDGNGCARSIVRPVVFGTSLSAINRPGAAGTIDGAEAIPSRPAGYTLFLLPIIPSSDFIPSSRPRAWAEFRSPVLPCAITAAPAVGPPRPLCEAGRSSRRRLRRA